MNNLITVRCMAEACIEFPDAPFAGTALCSFVGVLHLGPLHQQVHYFASNMMTLHIHVTGMQTFKW
jgi:hypothetical protein